MSSQKKEKLLNEEKVLNSVYLRQERQLLNSERSLKDLENQITQNFSLTLIDIPLNNNNRNIFGLNLYCKNRINKKFSVKNKINKVNFKNQDLIFENFNNFEEENPIRKFFIFFFIFIALIFFLLKIIKNPKKKNQKIKKKT